jgi:TPR repeat protein
MYDYGRGVAKDQARAVTLYRRACDGGNAPGCDSLKRLSSRS